MGLARAPDLHSTVHPQQPREAGGETFWFVIDLRVYMHSLPVLTSGNGIDMGPGSHGPQCGSQR